MKLSLFLGCVLLVVASGHTFDSKLDEDWKSWKSQNEKQYTEEEETYRRKIWEDNVRYIEQHNLEYSMGKHTFTVGMNQFGDLTAKEFNERLNGFLPAEADNWAEEFEADELDEDEESDGDDDEFNEESGDNVTALFVDWRAKGYVTSVKNQGQCGSCWAFSATGAIEGQLFHATKKLIPLSEQNLVDCTRPYGNHGCRGGWMSNAFEYVIKNKGINSANGYPYTATDGPCTFSNNKFVARIRHYINVRRSSRHLERAVRRIGPVAVAVDASGQGFHQYTNGIYINEKCNSGRINHAVLVVGYGRQNGYNYWLVKNSWGVGWGDQGYIKMVKDMPIDCGITTYASYPIV